MTIAPAAMAPSMTTKCREPGAEVRGTDDREREDGRGAYAADDGRPTGLCR
jgi:hypothetical protein